MLVRILEFREKLKNIYIRYDRYLLMGVRFLGTMFGLSVLLEIGTYWSPNMSLPLWMMLLVSGACALLPTGTISFVFCFVLMLQALEFSLDVFLVLGVLFLLMLLLYYSFRPHHGVLLGASLIAFFLSLIHI